jgi:hypothetical protein
MRERENAAGERGVKLLLDNSLSPRLVVNLSERFPTLMDDLDGMNA